MGDPTGFLTTNRKKVPRRPVELRIHDYSYVYEPLSTGDLRDQAGRCMDCGIPFCNSGCPLHNLIPEWNDLVHKDKWAEAITRLHVTNNFPEFTGTLCPAPCENACVLTINDAPVSIKEVERSIIERAWSENWVEPQPPSTRTGKRVAIVGSGPSGLAAAQQLNRLGHSVVVFEKDEVIGGLLVHGIPDFKIEKWMVQRRVDQLAAEGIEFVTNAYAGIDPTLAQLRSEFDVILLAVGALAGRDIDIPGRQLQGVHMAMDYLVQQNRRVSGRPIPDGEPVISAAGKRVVIIGGGDTGADCLGNAHREGAVSVEILTRGPQPPNEPSPLEWPDVPFVLRTWPAHEEGGQRSFDVLIHEFSGSDERVERVHLKDRVTGKERALDADLVLLAIGFSGPVQDELMTGLLPEMTAGGSIAANNRFQTSIPNVYVTGDAMRGASLVVNAIADGRNAAHYINLALLDSDSSRAAFS
jgi:glutamate synthase (NADPH) small chain